MSQYQYNLKKKLKWLNERTTLKKYSISINEYISLYKMYIHVNIHSYDKFQNLGMIRIYESLLAGKCFKF